MPTIHSQNDTAIETRTLVRLVSIHCEIHGPIFTHDMPTRNIWEARGIISHCHHRGCGGKLTLRHASKGRDLSRRYTRHPMQQSETHHARYGVKAAGVQAQTSNDLERPLDD